MRCAKEMGLPVNNMLDGIAGQMGLTADQIESMEESMNSMMGAPSELDGGEDGLDFYRAITDKWTDALAPGGRLYFEVGIGQADSVLRIMRAKGYGDIQIVKELHEIPRVVFGTLCTEI